MVARLVAALSLRWRPAMQLDGGWIFAAGLAGRLRWVFCRVSLRPPAASHLIVLCE